MSIFLGAVGIFLLGALTSFFATRRLYQQGGILHEEYVPNPVFEAAKQGHYDEAVQGALAEIHDEHKDYFLYEEVVTVYLMRAYKDESHREEWAQHAVSYIDKMVFLAPNDIPNLLSAAHDYERAGDLSKNGCSSYEKAAKLCHSLTSLLQPESFMVRDSKFPTKPLRRENDALLGRLTEKQQSWCLNTTP